MESVVVVIQQWVSSSSFWLAATGAFVGGALTAMSPCIIAMVPLLIGFIAGIEEEVTTLRSLVLTLVFISGFQFGTGFTLHCRICCDSLPAIAVHDLRPGLDVHPPRTPFLGSLSHSVLNLTRSNSQIHRHPGSRRIRFHVRIGLATLHGTCTTPHRQRHTGQGLLDRRDHDASVRSRALSADSRRWVLRLAQPRN